MQQLHFHGFINLFHTFRNILLEIYFYKKYCKNILFKNEIEEKYCKKNENNTSIVYNIFSKKCIANCIAFLCINIIFFKYFLKNIKV